MGAKFGRPLKWTGIGMLIGLGVVLGVGQRLQRQHRDHLLENPHIGDILVLKQNHELKGPANFWPVVVEKVTEEVIFVRPSNFAYPNHSGLDRNLITDIRDNQDFFSESVISYPRTTLTSESVEVVVRP